MKYSWLIYYYKLFSIISTLVKYTISRRHPCQDPAKVARFPHAESFPGNIPAVYLGKNPSEKSLLDGFPPRKKNSSGILPRSLTQQYYWLTKIAWDIAHAGLEINFFVREPAGD